MSLGASTTWLYYVDESYDDSKFCLSAMGLKSATWRQAFDQVKEYRQQLNSSDRVFLRTEIHARNLTRGRGRLGPRIVTKWRRSRIFYEVLQMIASLPDVHLFNICLDKSEHSDAQLDAWDRLLNRLNRTCEETTRRENAERRTLIADLPDSTSTAITSAIERRISPYSARAILVSDRGREPEIVKLRRKLSVNNLIPSRYGGWHDGVVRNIPLTNFVEDVFFQDSARSYFIQLVDCVAFALLKREVVPTPQVKKYAIDKAFDKCLRGICVKAASPRDPDGVVRH